MTTGHAAYSKRRRRASRDHGGHDRGSKGQRGCLVKVGLGRRGGEGHGWVGVVAAAIAGLSGRCLGLWFVFA